MLKLNFYFVGEIMAAKLNATGSWHDSQVAQPIYEKLCIATPECYYLVTDTAFPHGINQIKGHICAPMKHGQRLPADPIEQQIVEQFDRQLLSFCQSAEWGM